MRLLHIIIVLLAALTLGHQCAARPSHRRNHVQKRSWCLLKLCSYQPTPHRVQKIIDELARRINVKTLDSYYAFNICRYLASVALSWSSSASALSAERRAAAAEAGRPRSNPRPPPDTAQHTTSNRAAAQRTSGLLCLQGCQNIKNKSLDAVLSVGKVLHKNTLVSVRVFEEGKKEKIFIATKKIQSKKKKKTHIQGTKSGKREPAQRSRNRLNCPCTGFQLAPL
ncbi:hypothetical protein RR48_03675 [Papilio machaon]|uniref:Uncharacterized protein n=1 Tax=Papilio machaon TaxID=76193 RepID=A0A0N1IP84_PAPMA|nr:hypothetical protein RR48_03675 [Papilio machaon]